MLLFSRAAVMKEQGINILKKIGLVIAFLLFISQFNIHHIPHWGKFIISAAFLVLALCFPVSVKCRAAVIAASCCAFVYQFLHFNVFCKTGLLTTAAWDFGVLPFVYCIAKWSCGHSAIEVKLPRILNGRAFFFLCLAASLLALSVQLFFCFSPNIWVDEAFSVALTAHPWQEMIAIAATDVHPPLYYIILKASTTFLHLLFPQVSIICLAKTVSLVPFFLLTAVAATKIRRTWGNYVGGMWALSLFAVSTTITQGVEIRMYSWALLFVTLAYICAYDIISKGRTRDWVLFSLLGIASAYTHYYAVLAVGPVYLLLLYHAYKKGKPALLLWSAVCAATVLAYQPWLVTFLNQAHTVNSDYWISVPDKKTYYDCAFYLFQDAAVIAIVAVVILHGAALLRKKGQRTTTLPYIVAGVACTLSTIIIGLTATYLLRPVLVYRYLYPGLACFWLALIIGAAVSGKEQLKLSLTLLILGSLGYQLGIFIMTEGKQAKEVDCFMQALQQYPDAVLVTDSTAQQRTISTLTGKECLTFDKTPNSELSQRVYPVCSLPQVCDISDLLQQPTHPPYFIMITQDTQTPYNDILGKACFIGAFYEAIPFRVYVVSATKGGSAH